MSPPSDPTPQIKTETPQWLRTSAGVVAVAAFCAVAQGGTVAAGASAAAVEEGGPFSEAIHRLLALGVSLLTWALTVALWKAPGHRRVAFRLAIGASIAGAILMLRSVLGGLHGESPAFSVFHTAMATIFLSFNVSVPVLLGRRWRQPPEGLGQDGVSPPHAARLVWTSICLLVGNFLQTILGAIPRHASRGDALHIVWAFVLFAVVIMASVRAFGHHRRLRGILRPVLLLFFLTILEFFLGFVAYAARPATPGYPAGDLYGLTASLHQVAGALMQVAAVVLLLRAWQLRSYAESGEIS